MSVHLAVLTMDSMNLHDIGGLRLSIGKSFDPGNYCASDNVLIRACGHY